MFTLRRLQTLFRPSKNIKNIYHFKQKHYFSKNSASRFKIVKVNPDPIKLFTNKFHTSNRVNALPPLFWAMARPVLKLFAILFGRRIRNWWQSLPKDKKRHFLSLLMKKKYPILGTFISFSCATCGYYVYHLEEHPLTRRKRFIIFTNDQIIQLSNLQVSMETETYKDNILPISHPSYWRVHRVVTRLLNGNMDLPQIKEKNWSVTVVENDTINAFVFMDGNIFVFTGLLELCVNDDQLGLILGHEMAHAVLGHVGEKLSNAHIAEMLFIIPLVVLWSVFPDTAAIIFQLISSYFVQLVVQLPYSRSIETEADEVGLQLAAKSCFDVRQAPNFWMKMSADDPTNNEVEFFSTHPSHEHRKEFLEQLISPALQLRKLCKCPELK